MPKKKQKNLHSNAKNPKTQKAPSPKSAANNKSAPAGKRGARSAQPKRTTNKARTKSGKVPQGRTLTTRDKYLDKKAKQPEKERPVVVIETNAKNELAVVQLSTTAGKDRTRLPKYQQGQSRFKHYVEVADAEGKPIKVNQKFKENHPNMDVSKSDVDTIIDTVLNHSKPMQENRKKINKFRGKKE